MEEVEKELMRICREKLVVQRKVLVEDERGRKKGRRPTRKSESGNERGRGRDDENIRLGEVNTVWTRYKITKIFTKYSHNYNLNYQSRASQMATPTTERGSARIQHEG